MIGLRQVTPTKALDLLLEMLPEEKFETAPVPVAKPVEQETLEPAVPAAAPQPPVAEVAAAPATVPETVEKASS